MRLPVSLGWKAGLLLLALAIQLFAHQASSSVNAPTTTDVGVTGIQVPTDPVTQGDTAEIDVTVQNLGSATASVTVTLLDTTDSSQITEKTEDIDADATEVVTLAWDTTEASLGNHTLRAVAVVEGDTNVDNDSLLSTDAVTIVAPTTTDVGFTGIQVPAGPVNQGDTAEIKVTIENLGSTTASVLVILNYLDTESSPGSVGQMMRDIEAGETAKASFSWDTTDVPLGSYTFQAVALSGENLDGEDGNHENNFLLSTDVVNIVAPTTTDVGVTGIQVPTDPVTQGDTAEIDVTVQNLGSATASVTVTLLDTTDSSQITEKTEDIDADATEVVTLAWDTTEASLGNHTLRAVAVVEGDTNVDNDSLLSTDAVTIVAPTTTDVGFTGIQVPAGPVNQGDTAEIKVTIENLGSTTASVLVILNYLDTESSPGSVGQMMRDIEAGETAKASFSWDTTDVPLGSYTFQAVALSGENLDGEDGNHENNFLLSTDVVNIVAPTIPDVGVTGIQVPTDPVTQGDTAEIDVTVQNLGSATASVTVTLLDTTDSSQITEKTEDIDADATEVVTLAWDTTEASLGNHTLRAVAVVEGDTNVDNDSLLSTDAVTIVAPATYAVAVTAVDVSAGPVTQGDTVSVDVTVENQGASDANAAVTLLYIPDQGQPGIAAEKTVAIAAGESETSTLSWDTSEATLGTHTIRAGATLVEDTNAADFRDAASTIIISALTYGVSITAFDVPSGPATQGYVVDADVTIKNLGSVAAMFTVTLFDQPAAGPEGTADEETVEIAAAATKTVTLSWDTSDAAPGPHTFRAGVALVEDANVSDSRDSAAIITISIPPSYAVAVTAVQVASATVIQGATVNADVTVENQGTSDADATVTLVYTPAEGEQGIAAGKTVPIAAGESVTITLSWDTSNAAPGVYTVRAGATLVEDTDVADSMEAASTITISPPPYAVAVTAVNVASATVTQGNTVTVDVIIENQGTSDANAAVTLLYIPDQGQPGIAAVETVAIAAGESETFTLSWDTSEATLGAYTIRAGATLVEDSNVADSRDGASTITISLPPYAVAVTAVVVARATVVQGNTVNVDVTVENQGTSDANAEITLLYVPAAGEPGIAAAKTVAIAAKGSETVTLSWDTSGVTPGVHTMRAGVTLVEDSDARDFLDSASTITVVSGRIILGDDRGFGVPDASFGGKLTATSIETTPSLITRLLVFGGFAKGHKTSPPVIETSLVPHDKLFTTNAQATFGSGLQNPFELGEIRVTVHLEERPNSLGAYVMVGSQTFFADANGNCRIVVPSGFYDLAIQAPGYVSARIPGVRLGIGEAVTVPELTLPFGDSNGDGLIDILDLSVAAGNFGATIHEISLP